MRKSRLTFAGGGYYHCMSRVIEQRFIMGEREREYFVNLMRKLAEFSGLRILTYCVMSNHFLCPSRSATPRAGLRPAATHTTWRDIFRKASRPGG